MSDFYWKLILWDSEEIKVKPENAKLIQDKIATGVGAINTPNRSIVVKSIKDFVETSERYIDQKLLEDGQTAFGEPLVIDDAVMCRWVKKSVTKREYNKYYSPHQAYRKLSDNDNYIIVTWRQPIHQIDKERMEELSPEDELNLSKRI